jgi:hypothetical protein
VVPVGAVAHRDEAEIQPWVDAHGVEEAAAPAEVLPVASRARWVVVAAQPSEPDVELASAGGGLLHRDGCVFGEDAGMGAGVEVQIEEARGVADRADQPAVGGALDAESRQRPEVADAMVEG